MQCNCNSIDDDKVDAVNDGTRYYCKVNDGEHSADDEVWIGPFGGSRPKAPCSRCLNPGAKVLEMFDSSSIHAPVERLPGDPAGSRAASCGPLRERLVASPSKARDRLHSRGSPVEVRRFGGPPQANLRTNGYNHVLGGYVCRIDPVRAPQPQRDLQTIYENGNQKFDGSHETPNLDPDTGGVGLMAV